MSDNEEKYIEMSLDDWEKKFMPLQGEDGNETWYETYVSENYEHDFKAMWDRAMGLSGGNIVKAYAHIWTRKDGDDGGMYLTNGLRVVNRLDFCLCKKPWAEVGEDGALEDIHYEIDYLNANDFEDLQPQ